MLPNRSRRPGQRDLRKIDPAFGPMKLRDFKSPGSKHSFSKLFGLHFSWVDLFKRVNSPAQQITCIVFPFVLSDTCACACYARKYCKIITSPCLAGERGRARESAQRGRILTLAPCVARACASIRTYMYVRVQQPLPLALQREKGGAEHALKMKGDVGMV